MWLLFTLVDDNPAISAQLDPVVVEAIARLAFGLEQKLTHRVHSAPSVQMRVEALKFLAFLTCPSGFPIDSNQTMILGSLISVIDMDTLAAVLFSVNDHEATACAELLVALITPKKSELIATLTEAYQFLRFKQLASLAACEFDDKKLVSPGGKIDDVAGFRKLLQANKDRQRRIEDQITPQSIQLFTARITLARQLWLGNGDVDLISDSEQGRRLMVISARTLETILHLFDEAAAAEGEAKVAEGMSFNDRIMLLNGVRGILRLTRDAFTGCTPVYEILNEATGDQVRTQIPLSYSLCM